MKGSGHTHKYSNIIYPFLSIPSQAANVSAKEVHERLRESAHPDPHIGQLTEPRVVQGELALTLACLNPNPNLINLNLPNPN